MEEDGRVFVEIAEDSTICTSITFVNWEKRGQGVCLPHSLALFIFAQNLQPSDECLL